MREQFRFHGRVQGVGFRATTLDCARGLPITGFVRNEPDGTVLLEAQGNQATLDLLITRITDRFARNITRTDRLQLPDHPDEPRFELRR